jgi:hypothetical protein
VHPFFVMPGFMPGIHVLLPRPKDMDGRDEPGHDGKESERIALSWLIAG